MTPYYADDLVTIYHARCEDVLPSIDPADVNLLLTDPPYGIDLDTDYSKRNERSRTYQVIDGDAEPFDPAHLLPFGRCVLWGGNHFADKLPASAGWLFWDKRTLNDTNYSGSEAELAWTNVCEGVRGYRHLWLGGMRASEYRYHVHPTQKPVVLMRWIIDRWTEPGDLVLDPYMGSGPVAQACHELGRRYIGIELVEDYCKVAVGRLSQQALDFGGAA